MDSYKFVDQEEVEYQLPITPETPHGWYKGRVLGVATNGTPGIGRTYIVQDESGYLPNSTYPYRAFSMIEAHIRKRVDTAAQVV